MVMVPQTGSSVVAVAVTDTQRAPVCQHNPEPLIFEITYKSGPSGEAKCLNQPHPLTPRSSRSRSLRNARAVYLLPSTSYRSYNKLMPVNMASLGSCCDVKNCIPTSWPSGVGSSQNKGFPG